MVIHKFVAELNLLLFKIFFSRNIFEFVKPSADNLRAKFFIYFQ